MLFGGMIVVHHVLVVVDMGRMNGVLAPGFASVPILPCFAISTCELFNLGELLGSFIVFGIRNNVSSPAVAPFTFLPDGPALS
jgi:hypothetical protein